MKPAEIVDYTKSLDCIHCGLCLRTCPTYRDTGRESNSPRGRIHMMRSLAEGDTELDPFMIDELDACLVCRQCESVCPSGVEYAQLMEHTRAALNDSPQRNWLGRQAMKFGLRTVLTSRAWIDFFSMLLGLGQKSKLFSLLGPLARGARALPDLPAASEQRPLGSYYPARGTSIESVAVLEGCVMPNFLGRVNRATVEVLQACQRDVHVPREYNCCGALHAHNGDMDTARKLARQTIESFESTGPASAPPLPVIVNSAGCGAHMKEYGRLLADDPRFAQRAIEFSGRVRDFSEYLADEASAELSQALDPQGGEMQAPLTFDDPCHLCHGQGIRSQPRQLLGKLDIERVEIEESESCCGSAGLYATLRPKDSQRMLAPRLDALADCKAATLITANPGCHLQWQGGVQSRAMDVEVLHIAEALQRALKE